MVAYSGYTLSFDHAEGNQTLRDSYNQINKCKFDPEVMWVIQANRKSTRDSNGLSFTKSFIFKGHVIFVRKELSYFDDFLGQNIVNHQMNILNI